MVSFEDDEENGNDSGSDNDVDETMEDVDDGDNDADADAEMDGDGDDNDGDNEDDEGDNEDDDDEGDDQDEPQSQPRSRQTSRPPQTLANGTTKVDDMSSTAGPGTKISFRPPVRPEALTAPVYDIVPTIAAPQGTSINAVTSTPDMRWVFSGGSDGYIRKFSWPDSANGKLMLTVAQRHPFVDSVTKAGVLLSYWENEDSRVRTPIMNAAEESVPTTPVYSLAVHHHALWLLSGGESGGINLQTVRHNEGTKIVTLSEHTSAVSVLQLSEDEKSVLSGSWDKSVIDWDLNNGQVKRKFEGSAGQISAIEPRPISTLPVPRDIGVKQSANGTFSSNNAARPTVNGDVTDGNAERNGRTTPLDTENKGENEDAPGSPDDMDSLFGDDDDGGAGAPSLGLGEGADNEPLSMPGLDEEEDEFSRAIREHADDDAAPGQQDADAEANETGSGGAVQPPTEPATDSKQEEGQEQEKPIEPLANGTHETSSVANGLPHSEDTTQPNAGEPTASNEAPPTSDTTFLDAAIDGVIRVWDRRSPNPVAKIVSMSPWCMNACWSPDGNAIYAGRRNGTVDEYNLHKGLKEPNRTFRFPGGSGPVSAVRAMPNGRHLICASFDILRLYDLQEQPQTGRHSVVPFLIVPGHRTGVISQLYMDPACNFLISAAGNRGWDGASTEVLLGYEIGVGS